MLIFTETLQWVLFIKYLIEWNKWFPGCVCARARARVCVLQLVFFAQSEFHQPGTLILDVQQTNTNLGQTVYYLNPPHFTSRDSSWCPSHFFHCGSWISITQSQRMDMTTGVSDSLCLMCKFCTAWEPWCLSLPCSLNKAVPPIH